jgi:phosphoenolpyruvate carboxylase
MDKLIELARKNYRQLLDHPDFMTFYAHATPIDVLEQSKIGSRPARRTGQRSLEDLRSIPWVFSWNQSRFNITGWFGTGRALAKLQQENIEAFQTLKSEAQSWPFLRYLLIQIESNLLNANPDIMKVFAALVPDENVASELMDLILTDYNLSLQKIGELTDLPLESRRISRLKDIELRADALQALHTIQVNKLKEWRMVKQAGAEISEQHLIQLLLVVNALSGGLKGTG